MQKALCCMLAALVLSAPAYAQRVDQLPKTGGLAAPAPAASAPMMMAAPSAALQDGVAAIVNDAVITLSDVRDRLGLVLLSAGFPSTPETRARMMPQVMRSLIEEQLQLQEGKKLDIHIPEDDITAAMNKIAQDNKVPGGDMTQFLKSQGVSPATLRSQVRAGMMWGKVVMRQIRPRIDIGDDEIDAQIQKMRANAGKQEYLVSEILLTVDKPEEEAQVKSFADDLVEKIKGGATFGALARQFSQNSSAGTGGDIGWIQSGALDSDVDRLMQSLDSGQIGGPVRSASGYHILGIRDKRTIALGDLKDMTVHLGQLFKAYTPRADRDTVLAEAERLRAVVTSCDGVEAQLKPDFENWRWQDLGTIKMDDAPQWLADKTGNLNVGEASEPMATDRGVLLVYMCERNMPENINRDMIRTAIGTEKMELLARRFMRDLRSDAFIDVRLKAVP